ncbi:PREDICTED: ribosome biogenesis protein BRX1 homolog [Polistes canadensis]|uniref:ribosome biogenesis protein BRX1 homolog n=1 Tax=Polistes canadensis TaxID=91411 RepID=UPI000718F9FB|nr:PREDICTED: ribosome biogenesis protein BRX1 homolog [Polistes canadensis]
MTNKRKQLQNEETTETNLSPVKRMSDEPPPKKVKWINRQRVLVFSTRGIGHIHRHLMEDIKNLMPHHRPESKMERSKDLQVINEICLMKNCNKCILFEGRKKRDLYVWFSNISGGPCVKFLVENIYTMGELKMTGNCLKGSRPLLSFDENFNTKPHYNLLKELFTQIFGVPNHHPKSQPFFDHVYTFTVLDNRIWFRNFQILTEDGGLAEIGPRFVLNPVKIFSSSFGGDTLWDNPLYVSPAKFRQLISKRAGNKYVDRLEQKIIEQANKPKKSYDLNPLDEIFKGDPLEKALQLENKDKENKEKKGEEKKEIPRRNRIKKENKILPNKQLKKKKMIKKKIKKNIKKKH